MSSICVDGRLELAHLRLLRAEAGGDVAYETAEQVVTLLATAAHRGIIPGHRSGSTIADEARQAILADDPAAGGLVQLSAALGVSPYRLSRAFTHHVGISVTRFRNRMRVSRALARLDEGESDLARLAADLGFADQAHLTRTVKAEVGLPPAALRRLLAG